MDPNVLLEEIDKNGFGWQQDGPTLNKLIDYLNSCFPASWPESVRESIILGYLIKEATARGWKASAVQTSVQRDFLLKALVGWRVR